MAAYKRLGDLLVGTHVITEEQLDAALAEGKEKGTRLGETLINMGLLTERQIIEVLSAQLGVEYINLNDAVIPMELAQYVPRNMARKNSVVPVKVQGDNLYLAMQDPMNFNAVEDARKASRKNIIPMIATADGIQRAMVTLYGNEGVSKAIKDLKQTVGDAQLGGPANNILYTENDENAAPTIRLVNSVIERGVTEHASDIHMEPREGGLFVRMRVDGVLHTMLTIPSNLQNAVISRVKVMGDMDIAEHRVPQDGRAQMHIKDQDIDLRISTLPTIYGEKIVIRFLEKSEKLLTSAGIGLTGEHLEKYNDLIQNANGVILISGPTGSGKSTTMYTMVCALNNDEVNVMTLEDPIEYNIDGVNQVQVNEKTGMTFANGLRSILRQDPDIIAVGEIRDEETAEIAMRSAITGHLVLSTIHTNNAIATLDRLVDIGIEPYLITTAVKGVIAQRLVRKICPYCKEEYTPSEEELSVLDFTLDDLKGRKFYRGKGCPDCLNTGYRGRTGVFEILTLTNEVKNLFREGVSNRELTAAIMKSGFKPMIEDCRKLVLAGETTAAEAQKILHTTDD